MFPDHQKTELAKQQLLAFIKPFGINAACRPTAAEREHIMLLIDTLVQTQTQSSSPLEHTGTLLTGTWQCRYTSSAHVLGLNKVPALHLSSVFQKIRCDALTGEGYYINLGELSGGSGKVRLACGEYAHICLLENDQCRIDVAHEYFYFATRLLRTYEGHNALFAALETKLQKHVIRYSFRKIGWQSLLYLDTTMRIVRGNNGGLFILTRLIPEPK